MRLDGRRVPAGTPATRGPLMQCAHQPRATRRDRIVAAEHERLVVTYSVPDDTAYVLMPRGEDPRAVLRAARLVLHDEIYRELAGYLAVAATAATPNKACHNDSTYLTKH